jgi:hypothetical protein
VPPTPLAPSPLPENADSEMAELLPALTSRRTPVDHTDMEAVARWTFSMESAPETPVVEEIFDGATKVMPAAFAEEELVAASIHDVSTKVSGRQKLQRVALGGILFLLIASIPILPLVREACFFPNFECAYLTSHYIRRRPTSIFILNQQFRCGAVFLDLWLNHNTS